jgi:bifunctional ADP-heptose synthase (sugar kinase/adenylyltransferase)
MENRCYYTEAATATTIKTGRGVLRAIVVGSTPAKAIEIYDSAGSGGTKLGELKTSIAEGTYEFDCVFGTGLHISNPGGGKISIIYR